MFDYTGIPYKEDGYTKEGVDCWGIIYLVYKDLGIELPKYKWQKTFTKDANKEAESWKLTYNIRPYNVASLERNGEICHCAMFVTKKNLLHATGDRGVTITKLEHLKRIYKVRGIYEYKVI